MAASNLAEMQWVDIIPPDATATPLDFAMVAATLAAIAIVIVAIYFYLSRPKQQARRKILALAGRDNLNNDQRRDGSARDHLNPADHLAIGGEPGVGFVTVPVGIDD